MKKNAVLASLAVAALSLTGLVGVSSAQAADRTVVVWHPYKGGNQKLFEASMARIEAANPGLKITSVGSIDMAKSLAAINAGNGPDISVSNGAGNLGWFCGTGAWQNLNKWVLNKKVGIDLKATFTPASIASTISNKVRCALPLNSEVFGFYYNKDLLAKAGFDNPPKTTDELLAYSKKITTFESNGDIKVAGFVPWAGYYGFDMDSMWLGQMFGAKWYMLGGNGASGFGVDPAWQKALQWQRDFIAQVYGGGNFDKGSQRLTKFVAGRGGEWGTEHDFIKGRVAMKWDANWMAPMFCTGDDWALAEKCTTKVNFGIAPSPVAPKLVSTLYGAGTVGEAQMGISKGSKNVADAWTVIKGLATDTKLAADWDAANGAPSMLIAKAAKPAGQPAWYDPIYAIASHKLSGYHQMLNTGEHQEEALLQNLMASWQAGKTSNLNAALKDLGVQVNQIIARNS